MKDKYPKALWAVTQLYREGQIEDICCHGIGHPNKYWLQTYPSPHNGIHGCDGCCMKETTHESH